MRMLSILVLAALAAGAVDDLKGQKIALTGGDHTSRNLPVALPYTGPAVEGAVLVEHPKTGKSFPATVRDGALVFVAEGAMPGSEQRYEVAIETGDRAPQVRVEKQADKDAIDVFVHDQHVVTYNYGSEWKKPFLWPVKGENGIHLTRDWPMVTPGVEKSEDHVHQKSMWTAHGALNGVDFWGEGNNSGRQVSQDVAYGSGDGYGWIHAKNTWVDKDGNAVIDEEREYRFYATPAQARLFDATITFTAAHGVVAWGDTKEGGIMALRIRPEMEERRGGTITTNNGTGSKECWGKPAAWCDYSGNPDGSGIHGITVFDHPENFRHPAHWHVRDYGLNGANDFGYHDFYGNDKNEGEYAMKAGETLTFNYRVLLHSGDAGSAHLSDYFADYAHAPQAVWAE